MYFEVIREIDAVLSARTVFDQASRFRSKILSILIYTRDSLCINYIDIMHRPGLDEIFALGKILFAYATSTRCDVVYVCTGAHAFVRAYPHEKEDRR